jgi:vitamin B12 transporter
MRVGRTTTLAAALAAAALLGSSEPAPGQEEAPGDTAAYELEELVVTAARGPMAPDRLPWRTTVLEGEDLRADGVQFLETALRGVPGASFASQGPYGALTSLFLRGGESDYVKVLVDGVPVNRPGGSYDFAHLTAAGIERVEILRGPGSVLYGSDAMTGVIQLFTQGGGEGRASASVRGGANGTLVLDLSASGGTGETGYGATVSRFATDGVLPFNNDYRNTTASGRFHVRPDESTRAAVTLRYADSEYHFPTDFAGDVVDENQFQTRDETVLGLDVDRRLAEGLTLSVGASTHAMDYALEDRPDGPADTTGTFASETQRDQDRHGGELLLDWRPEAETRLTLGASLQEVGERSFTRSRSGFGASASTTSESRTDRAVFLQAVRELAGRVTLTLGARLDDNSAFGTFDTYRAGAVYRAGPSTRLRAAFGTGFKAPTFFENFAEGLARGNPDLDPERSRSWEAGLTHEVRGAGLTLAATYFDQTFRDLIQFTFEPPESEGPNFFNVAEAEASGMELEASWEPHARFSASGSYTYLDTDVVDAGFQEGEDATFVAGEPLLRRPTHSASLQLSGRPLAGLRLSTSLDWVGERVDRDFGSFPAERVTLEDYLRVNASARLELAGGAAPRLTPVLRVENLLDSDYREIAGFPGRGRAVYVGVTSSLGL